MQIKKHEWVLEWSFNQRCFHIEPLLDAIKCNLRCYISDGATDYVLMGIFNSDDEASKAAQMLREKRPDLFPAYWYLLVNFCTCQTS